MKTYTLSKFRIILFISCLTLIISCDGFVDVDLPSAQLTGPAVFQDKATANAALVDIYAKMRDNGFFSGNLSGVTLSLGLYADELDYYGPASDPAINYFQNGLLASDSNALQVWNNTYNQIYAANAVLEGLYDSPISEADKNQFQGEALFIRSLLHFYLANTFGDVPLITTTNYQTNRTATRTAVNEIYERIISDLKQALQLVQQQYTTNDRVRPNRSVISALLAKIYLFNRQWSEASKESSTVISQSQYSLNVPLRDVFLMNSPSTIWQLYPKAPGNNTDFAITFIFQTGPPPFVALKKALVDNFENGDNRLTLWVGTVNNGTSKWFYPSKYDYNTATSSSREFPIIFRLQEQFLIRAEARARLGELDSGKEDLNIVRSAAGLTASQAANQQQLIEAIIKERRVELFTEFGNRFYDLKRNEMLDPILSGTKAGWNNHDSLWPIPDNELRANINLQPQNLGY